MNIKLIVAAAAVALSAPAFAASEPVDTAIVEYGDLNLSSARGVATLQRRINHAAKQVCGEVPSREIALRQEVIDCQAGVIANAAAQLQPVLSAAGNDIKLAQSLVSRAR